MTRKLTASLLILAAVLANVGFTGARHRSSTTPTCSTSRPARCSRTFRDNRGRGERLVRVLALWPRPCSLRSRSASDDCPRSGRCGSRCRSGSRRPSCRSSACCDGRSSCPATRPTRSAATPPSRRPARLVHDGERHPRHGRRRDRRLPPDRRVDGARHRRTRASLRRTLVRSCWAASSAVLVLVGVLSPLGLPVIDTANFVGYVLWSVWLIALAVVMLVHERRRTAPARAGSW